MLKNLKSVFAAALTAFVFASPLPVQAGPILDLEPGGNPLICGGCGVGGSTFGWAFDVTSAITVDGLGAWDFAADGIGPAVEVGLWTDSGLLLASATLSDASPLESSAGDGAWRFEDIAALTLDPGRYALGLVFFDTTPLAQLNADIMTIPEITFVEGRFSNSIGSGFLFPGSVFLDPIFGPNLRTQMIPEPGTFALLGLGLTGFGAVRRRKRAVA